MKILKLDFKNLNSLKGEWHIDFTDPAYVNDGLFAIVGPTGAGKTTILDAICLSLYCKTPRLGSITDSSNEMINRSSGDCYAQTTFSCEKGVFRAYFEHHYAFNNRDGKLRQATFEIANAETGEILASTKTQVAQKVTELIGLTYEQFTRAVLLAQGKFKEFLDSKANDRSELLETITGTQIYSTISMKVYERYRDENGKLEPIKNQLDLIQILSDEDASSIEKALEESNAKTKTLQEEIERLDKQILWVKEIKRLEKDSETIERDLAQNAGEIIKFEPQRKQLVQDVRAQKIVADYRVTEQKLNILNMLDNQINEDAQTIKKLNEEISSEKTALENATAELNKATETLNSKKSTIDKVKALDAVIAEKNKNIEPEQKKLNQLQSQFEQACHKAKIDTDALPDVLTAEKIDLQISEKLSGLSISETRKIINDFNELKSRWMSLHPVKKEIDDNNSSIKKFQKELSEYSKDIEKLNKDKQKLESEKSEAEKHQQVLEKAISFSKLYLSLEEHRKKLVEGEPCPLCGVEYHQLFKDAPPVTLTEDEKDLDITKKQIRELQEKLSKTENDITKKTTQSDHADAAVKELEKKNESLKTQSDDICKTIGCDDDVTVKEVENRIRLITDKTQTTQIKLEDAEKLDALKTPILLRDALKQQISEVKRKTDELNALIKDRQKLFGSDDPDKVYQLLSSAVDAAAKRLNSHKENKAAFEAKQATTKQNLEARQEERETASSQYNESLEAFNKKLAEEQFSTVEEFDNALLKDEQLRERLQKRQRELDEQKTRLEERQRANKESLLKLKEQNLTDKPEEELIQNNSNKKAELNSLLLDVGSKKEQLKTNEQNKKRHADVQAEFDKQKAIADQWSNLNNYIGSQDGKKYRKIVQRMSLETLIDYANDQMEHLAPRYQLTLQQTADSQSDSEEQTSNVTKTTSVSGKDNLSIFCIDFWQGGVVRPTSNLSGGESFLISLALALGLSKMSSQNRSLETLFLDEGFGTLDEETLQTALDAINKFQYSDDSNKLVGIISHVDALKERIANKIEVSRTSAGASVLSGPGITRIS